MKFESFPSPKSDKELDSQVKQASKNLETELVHESMKDDLGLLSINELKGKYKVRYDTYLANLRAEKRGEQLEQKDLKKAQVLITAFNNLDNYIQEQQNGERKILRGRQIPVFNDIRNALERGVTRGYIKLPTGVGKTVLFSQVLEALKLKAFIGVPNLPLIKQTSDKLETFTTRSYGNYSSDSKDLTKDITTITYPSLINTVRDGVINPDEIPIFIADEAHKALGPETSKAIDAFEGIIIGFTATPKYSEEKHVKDLLPEEIHSMDLKEAIQEGLICRTKTIHVNTSIDLSQVPLQNGDYAQKQLEKAVNVYGRNKAAVELYKSKFSHLKTIVNCSGVNHAKDVAKLFQENGIKAAFIHGNMQKEERDLILEKLSTGEIQVVTNARLLIEGFDEPTVALSLNLHPTLSKVDAEQRGGRALRLDDSNPDKWGYVIDFIDQNSTKKPVLFSEILEAAEVSPIEEIKEKKTRTKQQNSFSEPRESIDLSDVNIENIDVVFDFKEVMQVTKEHEDSRIILEKKPGWEDETSLKKILGLTEGSFRINNIVNGYRKEHSEWFEKQKSDLYSRPVEHYSPELVEIIKAQINFIPEQKKDWITANTLAINLNVSPGPIKEFAEKYRTEHSEWFQVQRIHSHTVEHYGPELIKSITEDVKNVPMKKPDWSTPAHLRKIFRILSDEIKKMAEKYRGEHPNWFEVQRDGTGIYEHYSPELISVLRKDLGK